MSLSCKIFVVVVTYNGKQWYDRCFGSLLASNYPVSIIVVDNGSTDGLQDYIRNHFQDIYIISNATNYGFAKANNIGIRYALDNGADYVFLLNQDAWIEPNTIGELLRTFEDNEKVGVASPIHLNGTYSALDRNFSEYMGWQFTSDAFLGKIKHYYDVPFINAAAWMLSVACIKKVGGFDTLLFKHYGEDNNYLQRVHFHGMRVIVNTRCTICHDREGRGINVLQNTSFNQNFNDFMDKIEKANILNSIDIYQEKKKKKRILIKAYIGFHPKRVRRLQKEIQLLNDIEISRGCNIRGGEVWL